jgi:hypothetical protein
MLNQQIPFALSGQVVKYLSSAKEINGRSKKFG